MTSLKKMKEISQEVSILEERQFRESKEISQANRNRSLAPEEPQATENKLQL
jgi:hypothetical protein